MIKPAMFKPGDRLAAISLSWGGAGMFPQRYEAGRQQLEAIFGVELVPTRHALRDPAWIAANPQARAEDLMEAFSDPQIAGIVSCIGGDDSIRTLPFVDLDVIRANPKLFMGYSDSTVTHFCCYAAGVTSVYGPSILTGFAENGGMHEYLVQSLRRTVFSTDPPGVLPPNPTGWTVERLDWADPANQQRKRALTPTTGWNWLQGAAPVEGPLIGGCLEVVDFLRGTSIWPAPEQWEGAILFLETSEEAPSPLIVTRMLRSLAACGVLTRIGALLFGRPGGPVPSARFGEYDDALLLVLRDELGHTDLPIVTMMDFGHTDPMLVLPYGVQTRVDPQRQEVAILEAAVR